MMRTWFGSKARTANGPQHRSPRLRLEALEDRMVPTFLSAVNYGATGPVQPAIGNLTGGGYNDVVVANFDGNTVGVYLNKGLGDGSLNAATTYAVGSGPNAVALAPLTGSSFLDIVTANYISNTVSVLLGNGNGTFQAQKTYAAGSGAAGVAVADVNGDGIPDIITANYLGNSISVLLGNGNGTFQAPINTSTGGTAPIAVAAADFNGDGLIDVAVANQGSGTASVLFGNGDGTFSAGGTYTTGAFADGIVAGDLNGDSAPDFVVGNANANTVSVATNDGSGKFTITNYAVAGGPSAVALGNFKNFGGPDIVAEDQGSGNVTVLLNHGGTGVFPVSRNYKVGAEPLGVVAGDLTGSGYDSIVTGNYASNNISVLVNDTNWRPPVPDATTSAGLRVEQTQASDQQPAGASATPTQTPTHPPTAVTSASPVVADGSWVATLMHHHADDTSWEWMN